MKTRLTQVVAIPVLLSAVFLVIHSLADEANVPDARAALVEAARKAYETADADFRQFNTVVEDVYIWSQRLMEAEISQGINPRTAAADHAGRMRRLEIHVKRLQAGGALQLSKSAPAFTKYYVLAAAANQAAE